MKRNKKMDELVDMFIKLYAVKPKVNTLKKKEIQERYKEKQVTNSKTARCFSEAALGLL